MRKFGLETDKDGVKEIAIILWKIWGYILINYVVVD